MRSFNPYNNIFLISPNPIALISAIKVEGLPNRGIIEHLDEYPILTIFSPLCAKLQVLN